MLTGDKLETAVKVSFSAGLLDSSLRLLTLDANDADECKAQMKAAKEHEKFALVVTGGFIEKI